MDELNPTVREQEIYEEMELTPEMVKSIRTLCGTCQDVVKLADILGHSSIETTRIYLLTTGAEHLRRLERLGLLC